MIIETLEDWNMLLGGCGCCPMPVCPTPGSTYENVTSSIMAEGFLNSSDDKLYAKQVETWVFPSNTSANSSDYGEWNGFFFDGVWIGPPDGDEYQSDETAYSGGPVTRTSQYNPPWDASVMGRSLCASESSVYDLACAGGQVVTVKEWSGMMNVYPGPTYDFQTRLTYHETLTFTEVSGQETDEHAAWIALWGTEAAWQAAHDAWVIAHAAWVVDHAEWVIEWEAWDGGGQIGPEPVEPVEPVEPAGEPTEFYPSCTWRGVYNYKTGGYKYDGGLVLDVSTDETGDPFYGSTPSSSGVNITYEDEITWAAIVAEAISNLTGVDWDSCALQDPGLVYQSARLEASDPLVTNGITATARAARFQWVIPPVWTYGLGTIPTPGSYFKITWDVIEEPDGWDDPSPTVFRSFVPGMEGLTWVWSGPGDPEDEETWKSGWYVIPPPDVPGIRRVVNIRFECYTSAKLGNRPQVTGDAVELPDP